MKKLGFGLMRLPLLDENDRTSIDIEQVKKMVDHYLAEGFSYFDTAYMYHDGQSELAFKKAVVQRYPREAYTITDKMPMMYVKEKEDLPKLFNEQLERLGVDYFDYYWLHNLNSKTYPIAEKTDAFSFISKKKEEGYIKHIGFSFHDTADLLETILSNHPEVEYVQLQINYLDWDDEAVQAHKCYQCCVKHQKKVIVMEPIKGGSLAQLPEEAETVLKDLDPNKSIASYAIRYAASLKEVMVVLSGMSNYEQLLDNTSYMKDFKELDEKEYQAIDKVVEILNSEEMIPCTACQYCVSGCPKHIAIPSYFALYNKWEGLNRRGIKSFNQRMYYNHLLEVGNGKASECIACKKCENTCPQHIKIASLMKDVAAAFEG